MKPWTETLLEWLNCIEISETHIKDLKELDDGTFYRKLIKLFSWDGAKNISETEDIIVKFCKDEYPDFVPECLDDMEHVYITSLLLLHVSQEPLFYQPMCANLQHETQLKIKTFLEMVIPYGKNINRQMLKQVINEMENVIPKTPVAPKMQSLKDFFNSPAARSAQSSKLLSIRCKELRTLKTELEVERFEKADLQEDLRIQQNKVQILQRKLQDKSAEIKALREEKIKPSTPQSSKKNKDAKEYERYYRKEIDRLENKLIQKQCEIDKFEADNDRLTKGLTCMTKQCTSFKEKLENCEKTVEQLQLEGEIKDRELVNLRMTNEEMRNLLKKLSEQVIDEQSFEFDGIAPLNSPSVSFNNSEVLSSVIDIQLQEVKAESDSLKVQLDLLNKNFQSLGLEYKNTTQLLEEKTQILQETEDLLKEKSSNLCDKIKALEKERESILNENRKLKTLCSSQEESLSQAEESKNVLNIELNTVKEEIKKIEESLRNESLNNVKLKTELARVKSQVSENLKHIQNLTDQNTLYETHINSYDQSLKGIILRYSKNDCIGGNDLNNKSTNLLIDYVKTILSNFDQEYLSRQTELQSLKNTIEEDTLKLESLQLQIFRLEETNVQNVTDISKLKETIVQDASEIKQLSEEISYLKVVEREKQILEEDLNICREERNKKHLLLDASAICIKTLKQKLKALVNEYYTLKKDVLNQMNQYHQNSQETNGNILNVYQILLENYVKEQQHNNQLENEIADCKKKLTEIRNFNGTLKNDLMKNKEIVNNLEAELISTREVLAERVQNLKKLEKMKEQYEKQFQAQKFENEKILLNMSNKLKFKDERIENLITDINSLKLEKEHIIQLQKCRESEMKNCINELETKLLEKQRQIDQGNTEVKLSQESLELIQDKFEKLSKQTVASEMKLKEVITNLQEVRSNQDALLKTQEKALKEKDSQLEELQREFSTSKATLSKQFEEEKLLSKNLQGANSKLQLQEYKQLQKIEELQETLKQERNEVNKSKEHWRVEDKKRLEIVQICEKLKYSINDLKCTINETCPKNEELYMGGIYDEQSINNDDKLEYILNIVKTSINEIHASRKLILHFSNVNSNLERTIQDQKEKVENYAEKCEEVKLLQSKLQKLKNTKEENVEHVNSLIKQKQSLKNCLQNIIKSRENIEVSLQDVQQKWDKLLSKFHSSFMMDKSVCDELKNIQVKKTYLENTLTKYTIHHFQNIKPLHSILWTKFVWSEEILKDIYLNTTKEKQMLDTSLEMFSNEKTIIESQLNKNTILQQNIAELQKDIDDFSDTVISFEGNVRLNEIELQSKSKKLQLQMNELTQEKNNLESKLNCAQIKNVKLEEEISLLKIKLEDINTTSSKEVKDLKKELIRLKEENLKIREERNELYKRPNKEDIDKQLKDIHDKYKLKLDEIKLNMKTAYNDQIAKLNKEQEQCIQERLESLQKKMELQCRKQADELSKYKAHVARMSSQIWNVGEKLLSERQEKEKLQKELDELRAKYQNLDQKMISSIDQKGSKYERGDILKGNKEVLHRVAVIQEKTTYERRCSIRSIQTMGNAFNAEDEEGEVFDNIYLADMKDGTSSCSSDTERLSVLKKRNALCKPHLKSSYPAEMQFHPLPFTEEEIKTGSPDDIFNDSLSQSLLPDQKTKKKDRTQTSYKKPGPPTPSKNGGRLSLQGNELRSPNLRILKERNKDRATTTPRTLKNLFTSRRQDENTVVTPRGRRRSSIFRKHRSANDR